MCNLRFDNGRVRPLAGHVLGSFPIGAGLCPPRSLSLNFLTCEVGGITAIMLSGEDERGLCAGAHGEDSANVLGEVDSKYFIIFLLAPPGWEGTAAM